MSRELPGEKTTTIMSYKQNQQILNGEDRQKNY